MIRCKVFGVLRIALVYLCVVSLRFQDKQAMLFKTLSTTPDDFCGKIHMDCGLKQAALVNITDRHLVTYKCGSHNTC